MQHVWRTLLSNGAMWAAINSALPTQACRVGQSSPKVGASRTVAEMFCGCGGLSHGFTRTGQFRVVLGNDIKKAALKTFVHNHSRKQPPPETLEGDIRNIPIHEIEEALERQGVAKGELDCLIGGPPCQGFSQMRRSEERLADGLIRFKGYNKLDDDPRNDLVLRFLEIANALRPKIVLIENVPQMLRHGHNGVLGGLAANVKSMLEEMGFSVAVGVINSADYGVPQLRERSFFLASQIGEMELPEPTHANPEDAGASERGLLPWATVRDALGDLPAVARHGFRVVEFWRTGTPQGPSAP